MFALMFQLDGFFCLIRIYNGYGFTKVSSMRPAVIRLLKNMCCFNLRHFESALNTGAFQVDPIYSLWSSVLTLCFPLWLSALM